MAGDDIGGWKEPTSRLSAGVKRRGLLRLGTLITAFTGASTVAALAAEPAKAAPGKPPAGDYVPLAEKGAASGVATLDVGSKIPAAQLPDLSATIKNGIEAAATDPTGVLPATFVGRPTAPEVTYFVMPRGKDANDGLTLMSAKASISAAIAAAGSNRPRIILGVGAFTLASDTLYPHGTVFVGAGSALTVLTYTGTGTALAPSTPGIRTFFPSFEGLTLQGPGKATTTVGISLDSVTDASLKDVVVRLFGTGIRIHSSLSGGAVYNHLDHVVATSCGTGFKVEAKGCNATKLIGCRANNCDTGLDIVDSNNTNWVAGSFEANGTGVNVSASSAALADHNVISFARFEGNATAWSVSSPNVRDFQVLFPSTFGPYSVTDAGTRTTHWGNTGAVPNRTASSTSSPAGSWRFDRLINGGQEAPALVIADSVTTTGTPVTLQLETERATGYFIRGKRAGATYFEVRADGLISGGSSTSTTRPTGAIRIGAQWFDTTLRKPIWWSGTTWVDAAGSIV